MIFRRSLPLTTFMKRSASNYYVTPLMIMQVSLSFGRSPACQYTECSRFARFHSMFSKVLTIEARREDVSFISRRHLNNRQMCVDHLSYSQVILVALHCRPLKMKENWLIFTNGGLFSWDVDAIGKPQSGLFLGNTGWLGSYSECTETIPDAHYCLAYLSFTQPPLNITKVSAYCSF